MRPFDLGFVPVFVNEKICVAFCRPGSDLLSRVLRRSTIGAGAFHGRVRNGNGCSRPAITTRSAKRNICSCGTHEHMSLFFGLACLIPFACRSRGTPIGHTVTSDMRDQVAKAT